MISELPFPHLETTRLTLRKPLKKDAAALLEVTQDEDVMRYYGMDAYKSKAEAVEEINWFKGIFTRGEGIRWIITERGKERYIGDIGFHDHQTVHSRAEIGFKLARAYWNRGLMSEALVAVLEYGFTQMRLNRVQAVVDPQNAACLSVLRKAGFVKEGLLRDYEHESGGFVDLVMLSLLKRDRKNPPGA